MKIRAHICNIRKKTALYSSKDDINTFGINKSKYQARWHRIKLYAYVIVAAAFMVTIMFITLKIYPFGDRSLVYSDGDQYFGFLGYLQNTFFTNNNLLYSWSNVLGGNMVGTFAYYCASPFNLLIVFFKDNLMLGYHFIFGVKFVAAALCFSIMLKNLFLDADMKAIVLFSASYPFIGYMAYYAWNQSWMDSVIFLPLILLGIWKVIKQESSLLYIISLAVVLYSNYYIGFMVCIASVLFTICLLILSCHTSGKTIIKISANYIVSSMMAAALSSVLLLPTFFSLPDGRAKSVKDLFQNMSYLCKPGEVLSMMYTYPLENMDYSNNLPIVYVGIVQYVLVVLFFLNRKISRRYKAVSGGVLLVFLTSFANSAMNTIWHGTSSNAWFNYRYSFIVSFVLELMAFYSLIHINGARESLLAAGAVIGGLTAAIMNSARGNVGARTLLLDVVCICAVLVLLYMYINKSGDTGKKGQILCFLLIACISLGNVMENTNLSLRNKLTDMSDYTEARDTERAVSKIISDNGFYRCGLVSGYGRCSAMLAGFAGVQNYASTENTEALEACYRLGVPHYWMWCQYDNNIPFSTDTLLGIKYIVTDSDFKSGCYTMKGEIPDRELFILENKNALPVIFPVEEPFGSNGKVYNKFVYINNCWNSISSKGGDIFYKIDYVKEEVQTDSGKDIHIVFTAKDSNPIYAFIPRGNLSVGVADYNSYQDIFYLGKYSCGEQGEVVIHADNSYGGADEIVVYSECLEVLSDKALDVHRRDIDIEKKSSSYLKFTYDTDRDELLSTTIPFENTWHVYIDGEEVEICRNMDSFLAFACPEGMHNLELIYWPLHFRMGMVISAASILIIAFIAIVSIRGYNSKMSGKR